MPAIRHLAALALTALMVKAQSPPPEPEYERPVSWTLMAPNLVQDQKNIWIFPAHLVKGKHVVPTVAVLAATAALVAADPAIARYFRKTDTFHG
jgi:hypothetical protein